VAPAAVERPVAWHRSTRLRCARIVPHVRRLAGRLGAAIYAEVTLDLDGIGDLAIAMNKADYATARRYRQRFEDDMRLLDDLG
jgi:hypothetical protein